MNALKAVKLAELGMNLMAQQQESEKERFEKEITCLVSEQQYDILT
jgi:hypothetical protein